MESNRISSFRDIGIRAASLSWVVCFYPEEASYTPQREFLSPSSPEYLEKLSKKG
jgi:hypothetical protein